MHFRVLQKSISDFFVLILFCFAKIAQVSVEAKVTHLCMSLLKGQEPLYRSVIASVSLAKQKQMLGERLFPLIQANHPDQAGKITGILLEINNT